MLSTAEFGGDRAGLCHPPGFILVLYGNENATNILQGPGGEPSVSTQHSLAMAQLIRGIY